VSLAQALEVQSELKRRLVEKLEREAEKRSAARVEVRDADYETMTLEEYAKRWFVHIDQTGRKRPHVVDIDLRRYEKHIHPLLGHLHISDIGKPELTSWMGKVSQQRKANGQPYAKDTLQSAWRLLASMLRDAEVLVGIPNYAPNNLRFRVNAPTTRPKDTLTQAELAALLAKTDEESPDIRAMIWVQATTGMRFGEVSALTWDDIDFDKGFIHVRRSQVDGEVFPTKTSTTRTVPMYEVVADILREHKVWLSSRWFQRGELVFPSKAGTYRCATVTAKPLRRCAEKAGVDKRVTNQALRRTVNNLIRQRAGEITARAITGHATQAMTEHYSEVTLQEKKAAGLVAFGGVLKSAKPTFTDEFEQNEDVVDVGLEPQECASDATGQLSGGEEGWGTSHPGPVPHLPNGRVQKKTSRKSGG